MRIETKYYTNSAQEIGGWYIDGETVEYEIPSDVVGAIRAELADVTDNYGRNCIIDFYYYDSGMDYDDFIEELIERNILN